MSSIGTQVQPEMISSGHTVEILRGRGTSRLSKEELDLNLRALEIPFDANPRTVAHHGMER